ncbi:MAG: hypothetical protein DRN00_02360 [Thermoplasmata archaeon]|nr:MAG: hypothetical protein DRN00_02360 [Thermoplasmata archaeon]
MIFEKDLTLKDVILKYLKEKEESISSLHRKLEKDGFKFHRLVLTGYLKALADSGILKEQNIKPSKVYSIRSREKTKDIYEGIGEEIKSMTKDEKERAKLAVYVLQKLFHRPIFLEEVRRCGIDIGSIPAKKVVGEERMLARKVLSSALINIPHNNPAYVIEEDEELEKKGLEVMERVIISIFKAWKLVLKGKQAKLEG